MQSVTRPLESGCVEYAHLAQHFRKDIVSQFVFNNILKIVHFLDEFHNSGPATKDCALKTMKISTRAPFFWLVGEGLLGLSLYPLRAAGACLLRLKQAGRCNHSPCRLLITIYI